jgi:hypothetical protein
MAIYGPDLVSCSAVSVETAIIRAEDDSYLLVAKAHQGVGFPLRELEIFKVSEVVANQSGPYFFNVRPQQLAVLDDNFHLMTAVTLSGNRVRLYYNTPAISGGQSTLYQRDIDVEAKVSLTARTTLPFGGANPDVLDARVTEKPDRLYLVYLNSEGHLLARESMSLGSIWGNEIVVDRRPPRIYMQESSILDRAGLKESVQALTRREDT